MEGVPDEARLVNDLTGHAVHKCREALNDVLDLTPPNLMPALALNVGVTLFIDAAAMLAFSTGTPRAEAEVDGPIVQALVREIAAAIGKHGPYGQEYIVAVSDIVQRHSAGRREVKPFNLDGSPVEGAR